MKKVKKYYQKFSNLFKNYPRLLMIFGILIGVFITSFMGSIFSKKDNKSNKIDEQEVINTISNEDEINKKDNEVINYFDETYNLVASSDKNDESLINNINERVKKIYEFLFKNGTINGYTYNDISDDAKLKINNIALNIDQKIDDNFPNYKNKIKSSFNNLKAQATIKYLDTVNNICSDGRQYLCDEAIKNFNNMKKNFKLSFQLIKDVVYSGKNNLAKYFK